MSTARSCPEFGREDDLQLGPSRGRRGRSLKFYTVTDVAEMLDVSGRTVRRLIARGDLAVHRIGGAVRIADADLKVFLALHREG